MNNGQHSMNLAVKIEMCQQKKSEFFMKIRKMGKTKINQKLYFLFIILMYGIFSRSSNNKKFKFTFDFKSSGRKNAYYELFSFTTPLPAVKIFAHVIDTKWYE